MSGPHVLAPLHDKLMLVFMKYFLFVVIVLLINSELTDISILVISLVVHSAVTKDDTLEATICTI